MHLTFACAKTSKVVSTLATNDAHLVKRQLEDLDNGLVVRSFQVMFPCDFLDNKGVGTANVYEFEQAETKRGVIFHTLKTNFGYFRFGGPAELLGRDLKFKSEVVLYSATIPPRPNLYFEGRDRWGS